MTTTEATTTESTIDTYFAMWNEADRAKRLTLISQAWTTDGHYVDPVADVTGHDGLADMVEGVRTQFAGATLRRTSDIDAHHDVCRFGWEMTGADGAVIVGGIDVGVVAEDGRLRAIAGFFG